jgi:flagellar hook-associated protein 1 FlgK
MSSLTTALSALYAQRRGLDVTGHNIANANTEGYSRQRVDLVANGGPMAAAIYSRWNGVGQGVDVAGVERLRDAFLELRSAQEHGVLGELSTSQQLLARIELSFGEPSDLGLAAQFNDYYASWGDVANNPTDMAARRALLESAQTLTSNIRNAAQTMDTLRSDLVGQATAQLDAVNNAAASIADLNKNILDNTNAGLSPVDLMDQRDLLVAKLSEMVGVSVKSVEGGVVDVFVGGTAIVRGATAESLTLTDTAGPPRMAGITWAKDGYPATVSGGSISALINGANYTIDGDNGYLAKLDAMAVSLRDTVNNVHVGGKDLYENAGVDFFTGNGALDIQVSADLLADPRLLAASSAGGGYADNTNALALSALAGDADGPDQLYRAMIVELGVEAQAVNRRVGIQTAVTAQVDDARDAQAGVNLDEEMTNMLSYQRAYEAAARFMTAIDQMLDTLVNSTGLVGR